MEAAIASDTDGAVYGPCMLAVLHFCVFGGSVWCVIFCVSFVVRFVCGWFVIGFSFATGLEKSHETQPIGGRTVDGGSKPYAKKKIWASLRTTFFPALFSVCRHQHTCKRHPRGCRCPARRAFIPARIAIGDGCFAYHVLAQPLLIYTHTCIYTCVYLCIRRWSRGLLSRIPYRQRQGST